MYTQSRIAREIERETWARKIDRYILEGRTVSGGSSGSGQLTPAQLNAQQRALVLSSSVEMIQQVFSQTIATVSAGNNQFTVPVRPVGLVKHFILEISGTYTSGAQAAATVFGLANLLSNVTFTDLNNNVRINTNSFHLALIEQVKTRHTDPSSRPLSTSLSDALIAGEYVAAGTAPNFPVNLYPLPNTTGGTFRAFFKVPLAYSDNDLTGAVYANVINATMQLAVTVNPTPASAGSDLTGAVWGDAAPIASPLTNVNLIVYQVYLDQLPVGQNGVVLPILDLSTIYELKNTTFTGIVANQDFPIPYSNFRNFMSTIAVFNSTGATAGLKNGSDVAYWALQSANFTNIWKMDPLLAALRTRQIIGSDAPLGTYYFSHRKKPLSTQQYGNLELVLNAANVSGVPYATIYWEDTALQNTLTQAGSLAS